MRVVGSAALVVVVLLGGCLTATSGDASTGGAQPAPIGEPTVIAILDTGLSPYYEMMRIVNDSVVRDHVLTPFTEVSFDLPSGEVNPIERDKDLWDSLRPRVLYHFAGTRLFGISFDQDRGRYHYVRDANGHGAGTSYVAARDAPDAVIVVVQVGVFGCADYSCFQSPTVADGMEWIAAQDWIDVVSVSMGSPYNAPDPHEIHPEVERYLRASEAAAASGKIIVNSAGNEPTPSAVNHNAGPPWIIMVGGFELASHGEQAIASKTVDVVANYTEYAPHWGAGEMEWRGGTSFATPVVAGTLANALGKIRAAAPGRAVAPGEIRDALNASAVYFSATDWDPAGQPRREFPSELVERATLPIATQAQMGWGYVDASLANEIARRVLENDLVIPASKDQAALFQAQWQKVREDYWSERN